MSMPVIIWVSRDTVGFTAIGGDINAISGYVENPAIPTNIAKHLSIVPIEKDQQPSPDFFDAVLQPLPDQARLLGLRKAIRCPLTYAIQ
jgi:hypothetical protein